MTTMCSTDRRDRRDRRGQDLAGLFAGAQLRPGLHHPPADRIWSLAKALANTSRRLGFSIEGKILERRQGYKIAKAM